MNVNVVHISLLLTLSVLCDGVPWKLDQKKPLQEFGMLRPVYGDISNFSYTVAVLVDIDLLGGGALIQQDWVLTAASVLRGFNASDITVRVGSNSSYVGGHLHYVTQTIIHPLYTSNSSYNLALLKLDSPIYPKVATKVTYIARIPFSNNGIYGNTTGYGATSSAKENVVQEFQVAQGAIYTSSYCQRNWGRPVSKLHICEFSYYTVPCYGDDGDPLARCWDGSQCELLGIATGIDKCDSYEPYTFVDVGQFSDWILKNTNHSLAENNSIQIDV